MGRLALAALLLGLTACGGGGAELTNMVPGGNLATGQLECWLTLEFKEIPSGGDPRDVRVVFRSDALREPTEFDWSWIAERDVVARGMRGGNQSNEATRADAAPPLGEPLKVKFPLRAKRRLERAIGSSIWLEAELHWGGRQQDSIERTLDHMYHYES